MSGESGATTELDRIAERIDALVIAATQSGRPYFISALGMDLGDDLKAVKELTKGTLADFVRSRLSEQYEIARLGEFSNVLAIIPVGGEIRELEKSSDGILRDTQGRPKYHYRLWAAFSVPAPDNIERYLNLDDLTFVDAPAGTAPPPNSLPIPTELVPAADAPRRDDLIWENLTKWLNENQLAPERFYAPTRRAVKQARATTHQPSGSLLAAVLQALYRRQLQSTQVSLEVVATLLNARRS
jgi:hypothetical protein